MPLTIEDMFVGRNLSAPKIYIFALVTVLITLSGYLINDYFDCETDRHNDKSKLTPNLNLKLYFISVFAGFVLALSLALSLGQPLLSLIYLGAVTLLYLYLANWKQKVLIGNVVVAVFTAGVPLILLYAEKEHLNIGVASTILMFGVFSFLISMTREIIKDIEDVEGDIVARYKTLPIVYGIDRARIYAGFFTLSLIVILLYWEYSLSDVPGLGHMLVLILLYVPLVYLLISLIRKKSNWGSLSRLCKLIMIFGLLLLILFKCYPLIIN